MSKKQNNFQVFNDFNGRTCIRLNNGLDEEGKVHYIPMDIDDGFTVQHTSVTSFNQRYKCMPNYPVERACQLFFNYCSSIGATKEVLDALGQVITISKEDFAMVLIKRDDLNKANKVATKKAAKKLKADKSSKPSTTDAKPKTTKPKVSKPKAPKSSGNKSLFGKTPKLKTKASKTVAHKTAAKAGKIKAKAVAKPAKTKAKAVAKPAKTKATKPGDYRSAAAMFKGMIMEGKLTDDNIFNTVQKKFDVEDNKRYYVKWYRGHLARNGKNPPEPK